MTIRRSTGLIGGSFTGESVRPVGYGFPTGLSVAPLSGNVIVQFGATETWTVPTGVTEVDYLTIAGGGGGGRYGAGGAGGFVTGTGFSVTPGASITMTVGAGGVGDAEEGYKGTNGSDTTLGPGISATGGGGACCTGFS